MSSGKSSPTRPMYFVGPYDIIEVLGNDVPPGKSFGMFHYFSSIVVTDPKAGETAIGVQFSGYGSRATALVKDRVYFTVGRIVKSTKEGGYQCFFESNLSLYIGGTAQYRKTDPVHPDVDLGSELLGKVFVFGFGTIIKTERVASVGLNNTSQTDLHVTMRHYDYHNAKKSSTEFFTVYIVPGNPVLGNTFGFFTVDIEALMIGNITGFNEALGSWEVQSSFKAPRTPSSSGKTTQLRPGLRMIGGISATTPTAVSKVPSAEMTTPSSSAGRPFSPNIVPTPTPSTSRLSPGADDVSEGEIRERGSRPGGDEDENRFVNTYKNGKRYPTSSSNTTPSASSGSVSLSDAQKRAKTCL
ncbi:hypothetical protein PGT21_017708 [Puccinia graminis f. sp. tritici]|uniref:Uncharacterized protein n=1 Tax=Puccinia graminis f. sp. tritici TaxID=56615 RepID=A0A5B0NCI3_PUCGR|nr:hypothetical protein PGT21_017708 [Puccinia graminis f. sp. tritici]